MGGETAEKIPVVQPFRFDREDQGEQISERSGFGLGEPGGNVSSIHWLIRQGIPGDGDPAMMFLDDRIEKSVV